MMAIERMEFVEAVKLLADRAGLDIPEQEYEFGKKKQGVSKSKREELHDINKECARFFHKMLFTKEGQQALSYLQSRDLDTQTLRAFGIGYAPDKWDSALKLLEDRKSTRL